MSVSVTIQNVVTFAQQFTELIPLTGIGGTANEPALSIANDTMSELMQPQLSWKFNSRVMVPLVTRQFKQDYLFAGASAFTVSGGAAIGLASANAITESGNTVTVNTIEDHPFNVGETVYMTGNVLAAYNSTFSQSISGSQWTGGWVILTTPTTKSFTFTHASSGLGNSGAPGITDLGWLESASMTYMFDTQAAPFVWYIGSVRNLQPNSRSIGNENNKIAIINDDNAGTITFRLKTLPGSGPYGIVNIYQKKPVLKTSLSDTWTPFPDEYAYVYRQMFLAKAYKILNSPRSEVEYQKAMLAVQKALGQDDREDSDEYVTPESPLGYSPYYGII